MIEIIDLHKSFGNKKILNGVNLNIEIGSTLCIIGKSGCGKSVLLKHIVGLLYPDKGRVVFDGKNVTEMNSKEIFDLRKKIGFVFQSSALFDSYNVFENVILGMYEHGLRDMNFLEAETIRVLSGVKLLPDKNDVSADSFQKEWSNLKNKKPSDLSGGMKKRVGVARALVGNPEYIFYDEPTTGLDPVTSEQIDKLIADLSENINATSVIITHDLFSVFHTADTVALLDDGAVRFYGTPDKLIKSEDNKVKEFLERYQINQNI